MVKESAISAALAGLVFLAVANTVSPVVHASEQEPLETILGITTALGVETTVSVWTVRIDDSLLASALNASGYIMGDFYLKIADGAYLGLQFAEIEHVAISNGEAVVSLSDGEQFRGTLIGMAVSQDSREYDLTKVSKLEVQSSPPFRDLARDTRLRDRPSEDPWKLQVSSPQRLEFSVYDPRFVFEYYSRSGYALGGADRVTSSASFHIKVGDDEHLANVEDFETISISAAAESSPVSIRVTTESGIESVGVLQLKKEDDEGLHNAKRWVLSGSLQNGMRIALIDCETTLSAPGN